jgi:hypothetical protein
MYTLDVKTDDEGMYIEFPEGELEKLNWVAGDEIQWIDNHNGSWTLKKKEDMDFVQKVVQFNDIAGTTGDFDARKVALYIGLQLEEMAEKIASIPNQTSLGNLRVALEYHSRLFKEGRFDGEVEKIDRVEALDADIDLAVVALGGATSLGADVNGACHEVADSNLSKFPFVDGVRVALKDENGKVKKADGYKPPQLEQYLKK